MTEHVKTRIAKKQRRARTRRVPKQPTEKMSEKVEVKFTPSEKDRFRAVCESRLQRMATVLHQCAMAYTAAMERGEDLVTPVEFRRKEQ